ncbi:MAG TPA: hypothetical protein DCR40_01475 [Prolixibacteraceae bacterium]|nr:hypothetical protein [Prolixibacteraceae bacterium]
MTNLFAPLGINSFEWKAIRGKHVFASGNLFLAPRDLAKIGQLCLNKGEWNGTAKISKQWMEESTQSWIYPTEFGVGDGYGYQWWLHKNPAMWRTLVMRAYFIMKGDTYHLGE